MIIFIQAFFGLSDEESFLFLWSGEKEQEINLKNPILKWIYRWKQIYMLSEKGNVKDEEFHVNKTEI